MTDGTGLEVIGTVKVREGDGSPAVALPREALERSGVSPNEYAIVAANGRSLFLVPSTAESIREAIRVGDEPGTE